MLETQLVTAILEHLKKKKITAQVFQMKRMMETHGSQLVRVR